MPRNPCLSEGQNACVEDLIDHRTVGGRLDFRSVDSVDRGKVRDNKQRCRQRAALRYMLLDGSFEHVAPRTDEQGEFWRRVEN